MTLTKGVTEDKIEQYQALIREVPVTDSPLHYALRLVRNSRPTGQNAPSYVRDYLAWGAGPRAGQALLLGAKARCLLQGRYAVSEDDIKALAHPVLRHRLLRSYRAESENVSVDDIINRLLEDAAKRP